MADMCMHIRCRARESMKETEKEWMRTQPHSASRRQAHSVTAEKHTMADGAPPNIGPSKGSRCRVYWTGERRWFKGTVGRSTSEGGKLIHMVTYDDGDVKWHDMAEEIWLSEPAAKTKTGKEPSKKAPPPVVKNPPPPAAKPAPVKAAASATAKASAVAPARRTTRKARA